MGWRRKRGRHWHDVITDSSHSTRGAWGIDSSCDIHLSRVTFLINSDEDLIAREKACWTANTIDYSERRSPPQTRPLGSPKIKLQEDLTLHANFPVVQYNTIRCASFLHSPSLLQALDDGRNCSRKSSHAASKQGEWTSNTRCTAREQSGSISIRVRHLIISPTCLAAHPTPIIRPSISI